MNGKRSPSASIKLALAIVLALIWSASAMAAVKNPTKVKKPTNDTTTKTTKTTKTTTATKFDTDAEQKEVDAAQQELVKVKADASKAETAMQLSLNKMRSTFDTSAEVVAARKELDEARAALEKEKSRIRETLMSNGEYAQLIESRRTLKERKAGFGQDTSPEQDVERRTVALETLGVEGKITKLEDAAFAADEACKQAKARYEQAGTKLAELNSGFQKGLESNPEYQQMRTAFSDAKTKVTEATHNLTAAQNKLAEARRQVEKNRIDRAKEDAYQREIYKLQDQQYKKRIYSPSTPARTTPQSKVIAPSKLMKKPQQTIQ